MAILQLARHAMATRFEIVLAGDNPVSLRAAGEEALDEIERLEAQLSLFKSTSEIAHLNARAAWEPVRVSPVVFGLLQHAQQLTEQTAGTFDITIAPLVRCWGFMGGSGHIPSAADLQAARAVVGMHLVHLDRDTLSVRFALPGVMIDLGAIGKGFAVDRAVEVLREAGLENALIHGGTSTVYGLGKSQEGDSWKIAIPSPDQKGMTPGSSRVATLQVDGQEPLGLPPPEGDVSELPIPFATVSLCDAALSVSAVWGKSFEAGGRSFGHIIDPRTGEPASRAVLSAVVLPSATETDALSTALLTLGPAGHEQIANLRSEMKTLVAGVANDGFDIKARGIEVPWP